MITQSARLRPKLLMFIRLSRHRVIPALSRRPRRRPHYTTSSVNIGCHDAKRTHDATKKCRPGDRLCGGEYRCDRIDAASRTIPQQRHRHHLSSAPQGRQAPQNRRGQPAPVSKPRWRRPQGAEPSAPPAASRGAETARPDRSRDGRGLGAIAATSRARRRATERHPFCRLDETTYPETTVGALGRRQRGFETGAGCPRRFCGACRPCGALERWWRCLCWGMVREAASMRSQRYSPPQRRSPGRHFSRRHHGCASRRGTLC